MKKLKMMKRKLLNYYINQKNKKRKKKKLKKSQNGLIQKK